ncbi:MAG: HAD family phosphatase [Isosphaeraceae bacterium]
MTNRRPVLVFDFGNVVAFFDYTRATARLGESVGLSGEALLSQLREGGLNRLLAEYERGDLSSREFSSQFRVMCGLPISHEEFVDAWSDIFSLNTAVAEIVVSLRKQGYTLVLGSNTNELHAARFRIQFSEILACFDGLILSFEVGHLKPTPPFYLACAKAVGASPGDCLFIDDLSENVEGARAAGFQGLVFQDALNLVEDLRTLGVHFESHQS